MLPGFIDGYIHLFPGGAQLKSLSLAGLTGFDVIAAAIRKRAAAEPPDEGADRRAGPPIWCSVKNTPINRHLLDRILPDRPLALFASDHHTMWANTAALEAAGYCVASRPPPGNEVVMGKDGFATGELVEFEAFAPVTAMTPSGGRRCSACSGTSRNPTNERAARDRLRADTAGIGLLRLARHHQLPQYGRQFLPARTAG